MTKPFLLFITMGPALALAQAPQPDRKVRIEVHTNVDGEERHEVLELDAAGDAELQEALRQLGVLRHMQLGAGERDITIDIRGFGGEPDQDLYLRMTPSAPAQQPAVPRAYLGVSTRSLTDADKRPRQVKHGAVVTQVMEGSPAAKLGLKEGDIITEVDGKPVDGPVALTELVRARQPGEEVMLAWLREGKAMKGAAQLAARKAEPYGFGFNDEHLNELERLGDPLGWHGDRRAFLGVTPGEQQGDAPGAPVGTVEEGSAAERMGLRPGDRITALNGEPVSSFDALAKRIRSMKPGDTVTLGVERDGAALELNGALGARSATMPRPQPWDGQSHRWPGMDRAEQEALRREMDELRREMDELRRELGRDIRREVRVRVQARPLSEEEKALLRSKGVAVDKELPLNGLSAFPNPSNGFFRIQFELPERGDLSVDVHDAKGERVYQERITAFKGRYERTLDLSDLAAGSYFLVVAQGGRAAMVKLVKE